MGTSLLWKIVKSWVVDLDIRGVGWKAVHDGWNYRLMYEKDLKDKGRIDTYYFLKQYEEVFNFIAVAITSGVIGGFAYDVVKKELSKF